MASMTKNYVLGISSIRLRASLVRAFRVIGYFVSNPVLMLSFVKHIRYFNELRKFKKEGKGKLTLFPILSEYKEKAGVMSGHYFHQDLHVANKVFLASPQRHVDVGSRIDGFVAHVASFREIEIVDIRELNSSANNISFVKADLMKPSGILTDSLSCLHTIEHFGMGRYGDPINPIGHLVGFANLVKMVTEGGRLYISFPISTLERVEFNAHRIFNPRSIFSWPGAEQLSLESFAFVDDYGNLQTRSTPEESEAASLVYGCGIYEFRKLSH